MNDDRVWLICSSCGYTAEIFKEDIDNFNECAICGGKMALDMNKGRKLLNDLPDFIVDGVCKKDNTTICNLGYACDSCPYNRPGDNYPNITYSKFTKEPTEQEVKNNINLIGNNMMWAIIEMIKDYKLRLEYRKLFFQVGGTIPEKEKEC